MADECFSGSLIRALRDAGFDITRSADTIPSAPDEQVLALAYAENRILITEDNDFGELAVRLGFAAHGVVRVSLQGLDKHTQARRLVQALTKLGSTVEGAIVTVEPSRTRVRRLDPASP